MIIIATLFVGIMLLQLLASEFLAKGEDVSISQLATYVTAGEVKEITIEGDEINAELHDGNTIRTYKESDANLIETLSLLGVSNEALMEIPINVRGPGLLLEIGGTIFPILTFMIVIWFVFMMMRSMRSGQDQAMNFGRSRARMVNIDTPACYI